MPKYKTWMENKARMRHKEIATTHKNTMEGKDFQKGDK